MRAIVFLMIAGMYMLFVAAFASAEPIFKFNDNSTSKPGFEYSCPMDNYLIYLNNINGEKLTLQFPLAKDRYTHAIEPKTVLAGMWVLQSGDVAALRQPGKPLKDLLIPLFAGSLLIGLSNLIKKLVKKQPLAHHEKVPVKAKDSYEKTLWAESHGLM
jgi:hypothetical protein